MVRRHSQMMALLMGLLLAQLVSAGSPRINYLLHCSGCHLPGAEGNPPNVPTLHHELGRMMNVHEMREYLVRVPGSAQSALSDADLAAVVNWLLIEFNADTLPPEFELLSTDEVSAARKAILANPLEYRITHWRNYGE
jgi:hypothetical protein